MITEVPMPIPVTSPVAELVVMPPPTLLQAPPVNVSLNVRDAPRHIGAVPAITDGSGFAVTFFVTAQPVGIA